MKPPEARKPASPARCARRPWLVLPFGHLMLGCTALPPSQLATVNGRSIELAVAGHGSPVIVFESGLGADVRAWGKVFPEASKLSTVFAYSRPGLGRSDDTSTPRTGRVVVEELRALLREKGLAPPYVLVGHSLGGLYMQLFGRTHPDEVAGLVLVDTTPPNFSTSGHDVYDWFVVTFYMVGIRGREFASIPETGQDVLRAPPLMGKPVILLAAAQGGEPPAEEAVAKLYPGCRFVWVASGHSIQREQPQAVLSAIRVILEELRAAGREP